MEECIYSWCAPAAASPPRGTRYTSRHDGASLPRTTLVDPLMPTSTAGSMGRDLTAPPRPGAFLRAHTAQVGPQIGRATAPAALSPPPPTGRRRASSEGPRKPPVPPARCPPRDRSTASPPRDYLVENAVACIASVVSTPPGGAAASAAPNWLAKSEYGKVPSYLQRIKATVEQEAAVAREAAAARSRPPAGGPSAEEREEQRRELQARWGVANERYQRIAHKRISSATSIRSEIRFKETCEKELTEIEMALRALGMA